MIGHLIPQFYERQIQIPFHDIIMSTLENVIFMNLLFTTFITLL